MSIRGLDALLAPRSLALLLDRTTPPALKQRAVANMAGARIPAMIVSRGAADVPILPDVLAVLRLADMPWVADLAVLAGRLTDLPQTLERLGRAGTRAAVILTPLLLPPAERAGLVDRIRAVVQQTGIRVVGPGALGVMAPALGVNASLAERLPKPGRVAVVAQSATLGAALVDWAVTHDVGFAQIIVLGEPVDVTLGELLDKLALEPGVTSVLLHMETVGDARAFMSAARAAARNKPIIALRAGRHAPVREAVVSHTGILAGHDAAYDAALARAGVLRVRSLEEMFDAAETLALAPRITGARLAIVSNGAGVGVIAADELLDQRGALAELAPATVQALSALVPLGRLTGNPTDLMADADATRYAAALDILRGDLGVDAVLAIHAPAGLSDPSSTADAVIAAHRPHRRPLLLTSWIGGGSAQARGKLHSAGLPSYSLPTRAVRGFTHVVRWNHVQTQLMETPDALPQALEPDLAAAQALIAQVLTEGRTRLDVLEGARLLSCFGIPVAKCARVQTAEQAAQVAAEIGGPVALKVISDEILHKRVAGGVLLNLSGGRAVREGVDRLEIDVAERVPGARIQGYLVQAMAGGAEGRELILGLKHDPEFGPLVLFGHGGSAVEAIADTALALPPLNLKLAQDLIARTRIHAQLGAVGGMAAVDMESLCLTLVKLAHMATELPEIVELDINPLVASPRGVLAVDARVVLDPSRQGKKPDLAISPYPAHLIQQVELPGFEPLTMRPIRPEDEPALHRFVAEQSPEAIRLRFFTPMARLPHQLAARLTQIDYDREMAFVLVHDEGRHTDIYGVVRLHADPDGQKGEYAIMISPRMVGRGIGRQLMSRMIRHAREKGIKRVYGDVLAENEPMLSLAKRVGFTIRNNPEDTSVKLTELEIT